MPYLVQNLSRRSYATASSCFSVSDEIVTPSQRATTALATQLPKQIHRRPAHIHQCIHSQNQRRSLQSAN